MTLPQRTALLAFLLTVTGIAISYYLTARDGHEPWCIPHIDGCATITSTGVYYPAAYVFRAFLISASIVFVLWWYCARGWLESVASVGKLHRIRWMVNISIFASLLLVASIAVLGESILPSGDHRLTWRFHSVTAVFFFLTTSICQILMTHRMYQLKSQLGVSFGGLAFKAVLAISQLLLLLVFLIRQLGGQSSPELIAIVEWWLATLSSLFLLTGYWDWKEFKLTKPVVVSAGTLS